MQSTGVLLAMLIIATPCVAGGKLINVPGDIATIQAAINMAHDGDTVLVSEGRYYENIVIQSKSIVVASYFLMDGDTSHVSRTIIDGGRPLDTDMAIVVRFSGCKDTTSVLCGFTITGGFGRRIYDGTYVRVSGGVGVGASSAKIAYNTIVRNNITSSTVPDPYEGVTGGGIGINTQGVEGTFLVVRGNLIADNTIEGRFSAGGGIAIISEMSRTVNLLIEDNIIRENTNKELGTWKGMGGGLLLSIGFPTHGVKIIRNNAIVGNHVLGARPNTRTFGGGIYVVYTDTPSGTVDSDSGELFYNNIIAGNHSDYLGGGVSVWRFSDEYTNLTSWGKYVPRPAFVNNTIVNNTAMDGSGFFIMDHTPFLLNNILWNEPQDTMEWGEIYLGDVPEWTQWHGPNTYGGIALHYSDVRGGWGDTLGNIDNDPLFLDSTYRLSDTSPCIGAGTDSLEALPPYDVQIAGAWHHAPAICYYGSPRPNPADSPPDIGACENHRARPLESVAEERAALPNWFHLGQNYPNPFNPSTTIEFSFQHAGYATLSVYNVLGEEVAALIAGDHSAGTFKTTWNTSEVPSGVYFYRLTAGTYVQTRKMTVIR